MELEPYRPMLLELNESMLLCPHMYFSSVEEYKGALLFLLCSIHNTIPGPVKEWRELERINTSELINLRTPGLEFLSSNKELVEAFSEAVSFYRRVILPELEKRRRSS